MATESTAVEPSKTFLDSIWDSIITPGAGPGLISVVNAALLAQILIFGILAITGWYSIHVVVMIVLSTILLLLFNWFVSIAPPPPEPITAGGNEGTQPAGPSKEASAQWDAIPTGQASTAVDSQKGATRRR